MRKRLNPEHRLKLVTKAVNLSMWRPAEIRKYIQAESGFLPSHKTIKADVDQIKKNDKKFYNDMALGGIQHLIARQITSLIQEIQDMEQDIKDLDLGDYAPATKANLARTKAYIHERLDSKREFLLDLTETYPLYETLQQIKPEMGLKSSHNSYQPIDET